MSVNIDILESLRGNILPWCVTYSRYVLPALALAILYRLTRSLLRERYEPETWAYLTLPDGSKVPLRHWEVTVGRSRSSDIIVNYPTVSRSHAAIIRNSAGLWRVYDLASKGGSFVNDLPVADGGEEIRDGDLLWLSDVSLGFTSLTEQERLGFARARTAPGRAVHPGATFFLLTVFEAILALIHSANADSEHVLPIFTGFAFLIVLQWIYYIIMRSIHRLGFEAETLAFFLCSLGFSITASSAPELMNKQSALLAGGLALFVFFGWWLRDLDRVKKLRWPAAICALALLGLNLILAQEIFGARNWISVLGVSFQPSEFVKIAFIYAGAATLDRLYMGRNLLLFIVFSAVCVCALALMGDFGTALIFFSAFLVIAYMRSGNLATVFLALAGSGLAGMLVFTVKPHVAQRFSTWGHVWEYAYGAGDQQTRTLSAAASGGLFGQGAGNGWLREIFAADTDLVFGMLCEELGLIVSLLSALAVLLLAASVVRGSAAGRSSFYVIAACATVCMFMVSLALNIFGPLDILPFTGVTFPFVSRGGSSFVSSWILLAFIKALDTRRDSSFAMSLMSLRKIRENAETLQNGDDNGFFNDYYDGEAEYYDEDE